MFLNKIRNIRDTKFVSATKVERAGKRENICVSNNVSATMCPRLPGPLLTATYSHVSGTLTCIIMKLISDLNSE